MSRALLQQALDALIDSVDDSRSVLAQHLENYGIAYRPDCAKRMQQTVNDVEAAIKALQAALVQPEPEPEPIGYVVRQDDGDYDGSVIRRGDFYASHGMPCYTRPPAVREPLTDAEIEDITADNSLDTIHAVARAIEAAHNIRPKGLFLDLIATHEGLADELKAMDAPNWSAP